MRKVISNADADEDARNRSNSRDIRWVKNDEDFTTSLSRWDPHVTTFDEFTDPWGNRLKIIDMTSHSGFDGVTHFTVERFGHSLTLYIDI